MTHIQEYGGVCVADQDSHTRVWRCVCSRSGLTYKSMEVCVADHDSHIGSVPKESNTRILHWNVCVCVCVCVRVCVCV